MRLHIRDLKKGMVVYECERGYNIKMTIKSDTTMTSDGYEAIGVLDDSKEIVLFQSSLTPQCYNLRLYASPQYFTFKDGQCIPNMGV